MLKKIIKNNKYSIISIVTVVIILGLWELISFLLDKDFLLPRFSEVIKELFVLLSTKQFYIVTASTLCRCLLGFVLSFLLGLGFGILGGISKTVRAVFAPIISFLRTVPTMALTLIFLVWLRSKYTPIMIGFIMVFPIIYRTICDSLINIDDKLKEMIKVYNVKPSMAVKYLYIPEVVPVLFGSMVTAFGLNIKAVISAEILSYTANSIGLSMFIAKSDILEGTARLFAWVLIAVILSALFEILLSVVQKAVCKKWK